uniref:Uncharacterized protein n=1 Tax=Glossina austeni TaxID=7395 RepID=A0A1A9VI42_GLOAU
MDNCSRRCISCNIFSWALAALKSLPFSRASSSAAANSKCNLARLSCCSRIFVICSIVQPEPALNKTKNENRSRALLTINCFRQYYLTRNYPTELIPSKLNDGSNQLMVTEHIENVSYFRDVVDLKFDKNTLKNSAVQRLMKSYEIFIADEYSQRTWIEIKLSSLIFMDLK